MDSDSLDRAHFLEGGLVEADVSTGMPDVSPQLEIVFENLSSVAHKGLWVKKNAYGCICIEIYLHVWHCDITHNHVPRLVISLAAPWKMHTHTCTSEIR